MMLRTMMLTAVILFMGSCGSKHEDKSQATAKTGKLVFKDQFDRKELGPNWLDTGGGYRIVDGELQAQGARNKPLWLKKKLPQNARVEFKARSESEAVDIKVELYGDGVSKATKLSYNATSYVIILGGWNNSRSIIARMDEHGRDRKVRTEPKGVPGKQYQFTIERNQGKLSWSLDGAPFLEMNDPEPLAGPRHEFFAVNNWMSKVLFDDLAIYEL